MRSLITTVIMLFSLSLAVAQPQDGLVAYYPFSGNANDSTANSLHGTVHGATLVPDRYGNPNSAYHFDGATTYIQVEDSDLLDTDANEGMTVCAWMRTTSANGQCVLSKYNSYGFGGEIGGYQIYGDAGNMAFGGRDRDGYWQSGAAPCPCDDQWHCVVGMRSGAVWSIWIDGTLASSNNVGSTSAMGNTDPLIIGGCQDGSFPINGYFFGDLDDIRLYNRALSGAEIAEVFGGPSSCIAHWKFNEGTGDTAHDLCGNNDATVTSATWVPACDSFALHFTPGSHDRAVVPHNPQQNPTGLEMTIEARIRGNGLPSGGVFIPIVLKATPGSNSTGYGLWQEVDGRISAYFSSNVYKVYTPEPVLDSAWHRIVATFNSGAIQLWLDSSIVDSITGTQSIGFDSNPIEIGGGEIDWERTSFNGDIDEIRLTNGVLLPSQFIQCIPPHEPGLVAFYPFNGNADDASGNNLNGTVNGAISTTDRFGDLSSAYHFDGASSYIEVQDNDLLDTGSGESMTVCAWMRTASSDTAWVLSKYNSYGFEGQIGGFTVHGGEHTGFDGRDQLGYRYSGPSNTAINDGLWHFVVGMRSGSQWSVWVDAMMESWTDAGNTTSMSNADNILIGAYRDGGFPIGHYFTGDLDDIRVYHRALTAEEIGALYHENGWPVEAAPERSASVSSFSLEPCYPNPFNPTATIGYSLNTPAKVQLLVHNYLGQLVYSTPEQPMPAGTHQFTLNGATWASGGYIYTVRAGSQSLSGKALLLK